MEGSREQGIYGGFQIGAVYTIRCNSRYTRNYIHVTSPLVPLLLLGIKRNKNNTTAVVILQILGNEPPPVVLGIIYIGGRNRFPV